MYEKIFYSPSNNFMLKVLEIINNDGIVAIPTDTIYGIIGNPESKTAVNKLYTIKNRSKTKFLSIFVSQHQQIIDVCKTTLFIDNFIFNELGNNTIILEKKDKDFCKLISGETIGIRVPNNKYLLELLNLYKKPLFATSVNISGEQALLNYDEVKKHFEGKIDLIVKNDTIGSNMNSSIFKIENDVIIKIR